jgi:hypothetical protein
MAARRLARWLLHAASRGRIEPSYGGTGRIYLISGDLDGSVVTMVTLVTRRGHRIQTIRRVMRPMGRPQRGWSEEETEALFDDAVLR